MQVGNTRSLGTQSGLSRTTGYSHHQQQHASRQAVIDSEDSDLANIPRIFRHGRFWMMFSLAMMSFILAVLFVTMVHAPSCPSSCQTADCSEELFNENGEVYYKKRDCTCLADTGEVYCVNKRQTSGDKTFSVVSTLFFILFFIIILLSCCLSRCSHNYEERRVGTDPHEMQIIYPTHANITTSQPAENEAYNAGIATTTHTSVQTFSYSDLDSIPTATILRKANVPVAVAVPL